MILKRESYLDTIMTISKVLNQAEAFSVFDKLPKNLQEFKPESLLEEIGGGNFFT